MPARSTARASTTTTKRSVRPPKRRATRFSRNCSAPDYGTITTEILPAPEFYYAEDYHQQYLAKNPGGYCGHRRHRRDLSDRRRESCRPVG